MTEAAKANLIPRSLFVFAVLYGGMTCIAGIFPFLLLVVLSSAVAELHGRDVANRLVRFGFIPLITAIILIQIVLALPTDPGMYEPAKEAFPIILSQGARLMFAGIIAYGVSQFLNVYIFSRLANMKGAMLALRAAIASALSQIVDTVIFITIAFYGERPIGQLLLGQGSAKVVLSFLLVPFLIVFFVKLGQRLDRE